MAKRRARTFAALAGIGVLVPAVTFSQPADTPRPEPVAETRLLMEGLAGPNFRGLGRVLKDKPGEDQAWVFGRGQALLVAEAGNLLMLRPPMNQGRDVWMRRSAELRESATRLARALAARDYLRARAGLAELANACNRCHRTFRVAERVTPFAPE